MAGQVRVRGLRELNRALENVSKDVKDVWRREQRAIAEPVKQTAADYAGQRIPNLGDGAPWSQMRVGVTRRSVYVAPKRRGTRRPLARRPNFGTLLMDRAMQPALDKHSPGIVAAVERLLDHAADNFNRGGPV